MSLSSECKTEDSFCNQVSQLSLVFDFTNEECMLKQCDGCPSTDNLRKHISGSLIKKLMMTFVIANRKI